MRHEVSYKMPHKIEQYNSLSNLEKEHTKSVYLRNEEDKRRGVDYVMSKILGFYEECLVLGPEYATGLEDEEEVMKIFIKKQKFGFQQTMETTASRFTRDAITKTPVTGSRKPRRRQMPRLYYDERNLGKFLGSYSLDDS
ncbi:hypothetical protein Tco_0919873 [Tanacetum coccineum]